jgi:hypothetical protein
MAADPDDRGRLTSAQQAALRRLKGDSWLPSAVAQSASVFVYRQLKRCTRRWLVTAEGRAVSDERLQRAPGSDPEPPPPPTAPSPDDALQRLRRPPGRGRVARW